MGLQRLTQPPLDLIQILVIIRPAWAIEIRRIGRTKRGVFLHLLIDLRRQARFHAERICQRVDRTPG